MAARLFFRVPVKWYMVFSSTFFPKWGRSLRRNEFTWLLFDKWSSQTANYSLFSGINPDTEDHRVAKSFKTRSRNYNIFFSLPVTSFPLSLILAPVAFCGEDDGKGNSRPPTKSTKQPFFMARTSWPAKWKKMTQAARAELCKRRLFQDENNENSPLAVMAEAHQLRKRQEPQSFADKLVGWNYVTRCL